MKTNRPSTDALDPVALADAVLDGDRPMSDLLGCGGRRGAAHVRSVRRLERLLDIEKNAARGPDFTGAVLGEVGDRRGWLDPPGRRWVWSVRALAAAVLLAALGTTLAVRRSAPEMMSPSPESSALASVVSAGERAASEACAPLTSVVETFESRAPVLSRVGPGADALFRLKAEPEVGGILLVAYRTSASPTPRCGAATVEISLDPAARRTVETVTGLDRSPRWLAVVTKQGGRGESDK